MKRTLVITGIALLLLTVTGCHHTFIHHHDGASILCYSEGFLPFSKIEVDSADLPFKIIGGTMTHAGAGKEIEIQFEGNDSVQVLYQANGDEHWMRRCRINQQIGSKLFSFVIARNGNVALPSKYSTYTFKFLKDVPMVHPGGIGYYIAESSTTYSYDVTGSAPFTVTVNSCGKDVMNLPIYIKLTGYNSYYVFFSYQNKEFTYHPSDTASTVSNPYFNITLRHNGPVRNSDLPTQYYFAIER